jgi:hypothetical protein
MNKLGFYVENTTVPFLRDAFVKVKPPVLLIHAQDRGLLREIRNTLSPDTFVTGRLYVTLFQEPRVPLALPAMKNAVKKAYQLADGRPVEVKVEEGRALLQITRPIVDPMATVIVVEIEGDRVER